MNETLARELDQQRWDRLKLWRDNAEPRAIFLTIIGNRNLAIHSFFKTGNRLPLYRERTLPDVQLYLN